MKAVTFVWQRGVGKHDKVTEKVEYEDGVTEAEINEDFETWVWDKMGDQFTWYEEEEE